MLNPNADDIITTFSLEKIHPGWSFEEYSRAETGKMLHSCHRYPAKFIPQLVEKLFDVYYPKMKSLKVNDPFMGSGTTIACAVSKGFYASGTDINNISYLISKVKSTPINPKLLRERTKALISKLDDYSGVNPKNRSLLDKFIPEKHLERIDYWFSENSKYELANLLYRINEEEGEIKDFFLVCFSHILKNSSIWLQSSTKPTRDFKKSPKRPTDYFKTHLKKMMNGNREFYQNVPDNVKENAKDYLNIKVGDARKQPVEDSSTDIIITSSPYVTSYEYSDLHQLSTIWFDYADNLYDYRSEFIGTAYKELESERKLKSLIAKDVVTKMSEVDEKVSKEIETFFLDMQEVFDESYRILKPNGIACYVIGNTRLKKIDILNAQVFAESLQLSGLVIDNIILREIPSKILPQNRDEETGRFASNDDANSQAYPTEYIVIGKKE